MQNGNDKEPRKTGTDDQGPNNRGDRKGLKNGKDNNRDPNNFNFNFRNNRFALVFLVALLGMFLMMLFSNTQTVGQEIPYSQFMGYLREGQVETVRIVDQSEIQGTLRTRDGETRSFTTNIPYFDDDLIRTLREQEVRFSGAPRPVSPLQMLAELFPWMIGFFFIWFMFRQLQGSGNRAFSFGKSKAKRYLEEGIKITFADVAGQNEAKYELQEIVEFLKSPDKFTRIGAKIPKGVLLVGMPGTGKTLLAKACAGEAGVSFFHMSGSDFVEMFVGVGASRVRDLFEQGRKSAPCIIFIDELDAVGRTRGAGYGGGHDEREQTLNQMLVEMDGFDTKSGVIVLAATNRPDVLDPAILRPGRFDRQVTVDMPDVQEREAILAVHCAKIKLDTSVNLNRFARATPGSSGADLANLVNEAALYAARKNKDLVEAEDFEEARDKLLMGVARKSRIINDEEKLKTARHEAGHALLHYYLENADPLHKVTVIPRGRALGVAFSLPEQDSYSKGSGYLRDRIKIAFGGYIAERLFYQDTTTGVQNDLKQATDMARRMVTEWGMSSLGPVSFGQEDEPIFLGKQIATHKDYSESTANAIDLEVRKILEECFRQAEEILQEHQDQLELLAATLVEKETLSDNEIRDLLGFPLVSNPEDPLASLPDSGLNTDGSPAGAQEGDLDEDNSHEVHTDGDGQQGEAEEDHPRDEAPASGEDGFDDQGGSGETRDSSPGSGQDRSE
ncbi:ATP-dependent zinc metalloprotease FtsH [Alkalispirochaeta alkalica]|uniref:ATP-dependent zinc metalloprotease FtsH n=1 Tax=Alkalispirochaeta alkalica TaxID=46356 RepID=UPI0003737750|nr:ATP-dependent zinc metalloprotease FtsH [Alkalispirochaeta alkalica]